MEVQSCDQLNIEQSRAGGTLISYGGGYSSGGCGIVHCGSIITGRTPYNPNTVGVVIPPVKQKEVKKLKSGSDSLIEEIKTKVGLITELRESRDYISETIKKLEGEYFELVEKLNKEVKIEC